MQQKSGVSRPHCKRSSSSSSSSSASIINVEDCVAQCCGNVRRYDTGWNTCQPSRQQQQRRKSFLAVQPARWWYSGTRRGRAYTTTATATSVGAQPRTTRAAQPRRAQPTTGRARRRYQEQHSRCIAAADDPWSHASMYHTFLVAVSSGGWCYSKRELFRFRKRLLGESRLFLRLVSCRDNSQISCLSANCWSFTCVTYRSHHARDQGDAFANAGDSIRIEGNSLSSQVAGDACSLTITERLLCTIRRF